MTFELFTAVKICSVESWIVKLFNIVIGYQRFRGLHENGGTKLHDVTTQNST
jgi:hypothetical protein